MEKNGNGNTVLLTVIGVATLLVALVGATFAYFTATVTGNDSQTVNVQAQAPGSLVYTATDVLKLENATPGKSDTKSFTIVNEDANNTLSYDLSLVIESNTFSKEEADGGAGQLRLLFAAESSVEGKTITLNETDYDATGVAATSVKLVDDVQIAANKAETHTYTATVKFVETGTDQTNNNDAVFTGHFTVEDYKTISSTPAPVTPTPSA